MSQNSTIRRSVVLKRRPTARPRPRISRSARTPIPQPGAGEVVTRTIWLSIDPYMRGRLREQQTYAQPVNPGEVMTGETVGEVIASAIRTSRRAIWWWARAAGRRTRSRRASGW